MEHRFNPNDAMKMITTKVRERAHQVYQEEGEFVSPTDTRPRYRRFRDSIRIIMKQRRQILKQTRERFSGLSAPVIIKET